MKMLKTFAVIGILFLGMANVAMAQADNHLVNVEVQAINEIAILGDVTLQITTATAGSDPTDATSSTSYAITTNDAGGTTRITAGTSVDPTTLGTGSGGVDLQVNATAPTGGAGAGNLSLNTIAVNVVTSIDPVSEGTLSLDYTLSATAETGQLSSTAITVTYTIVN